MALNVTVNRVAPVYPQEAEVYDFVAGTAIAPGDAVRVDTTSGKLILADATEAAKSKFRGLALGSAGAGQGVSVVKRGHVYGYDLTGIDYGAPIYLDNTAGDIGTAAGTVSVVAGMVVSLPDDSRTKVIYVDADWKS